MVHTLVHTNAHLARPMLPTCLAHQDAMDARPCEQSEEDLIYIPYSVLFQLFAPRLLLDFDPSILYDEA